MTPNKQKLRAAIYARYSTKKQKDTSIEDQLRECEAFARQAGFEIVERFFDREKSGGTGNRPGYQRMAEAARLKNFTSSLPKISRPCGATAKSTATAVRSLNS